jgi:putative tryptophan/tyrosine transport system substrate-binding protein
MRRRDVIKAIAAAAAAWPLVAQAQPATPVIGFLGSGSVSGWAHFVAAFRQGLGEAGYHEGRNVALEFRWGEGQGGRLPALAGELVPRAAVILASVGIVATRAAQAATRTVPVVFVMGGDPVKLGVVASLNRPGANVTGVSFLLNVLAAKRIELLRAMVPTGDGIGLLFNPDNPNAESDAAAAETAARALGQRTHLVHVRTGDEFESAFARLAEQGVGGLFVGSDPLFVSRRDRLVALAARHRIPANYDRREMTDAGGLFSYGTNFADAHRLAGAYVGRILRGEKPADLPILQPTKFELVINLKTAKSLGLNVPPNVLALADEVIE